MAPCPACNRAAVGLFFVARQVPVHSVLLVSTREGAARFPRRDLELACCRNCGFIFNTAFDPTVHNYSPDYEETQGFSPTFNAFAQSLAERLIAENRLKGKRVLEIGCGKGEFVTLLCELGMAHGIGIDPAWAPDRLQGKAGERVEFIRDLYSERYAHLTGDLICCRHTLEHIGPVQSFLRMLRRSIGNRTDTLLFFEVPDTMRILREAAFWDIYYEHCSYFTAASLARLFQSSGFQVLELKREYHDQYLTLLARPANAVMPNPLSEPVNQDVAEVAEAVGQFQERFEVVRRDWRRTVHDLAGANKRIVLWGSGSKAVGFLVALELDHEIAYVVDINPHKQGKFMPGLSQRIVAPLFLREYRPDCVIVMNPVYVREIRADLAAMDLAPQVMTL